MDFEKLFSRLSGITVGVIGDVMLDTYWWGHVDRISPEAPVPVVAISGKEYRIGGAGNVALNVSSIGCKCSVISITGKDEEAAILRDLMTRKGINPDYIISSESRITTSKIRIVSRNQQMMRLDAEMDKFLGNDDELTLLAAIRRFIENEKPSVIILEDYNKGVLTPKVIREVIGLCREKGILTAVDPKRKNFLSYTDTDIFKPNLKEVMEGLNLLPEEVRKEWMDTLHHQLFDKLGHRISLITLSEKGIYYNSGSESRLIPTHVRDISDVSGAGDTVIAVAAVVYAATGNAYLMAEMANIAGGLVCEEVGTAPIDKDRFISECNKLLTDQI